MSSGRCASLRTISTICIPLSGAKPSQRLGDLVSELPVDLEPKVDTVREEVLRVQVIQAAER